MIDKYQSRYRSQKHEVEKDISEKELEYRIIYLKCFNSIGLFLHQNQRTFL